MNDKPTEEKPPHPPAKPTPSPRPRGEGWGEGAGAPEGAPRISGEFIRQALLGEVAVPPDCPLKLDKLGARLEAAIIEGGINLAAIEFHRPIAFERCTFRGAIDLRNAQIKALSFAGSKAVAIEVSSARIDGDFDLRGVLLDSPGAVALDGVEVRIAGFLRCSEGLRCLGAIDLRSARIDGPLDFGGATLCNPHPGTREDFFRRLLEGGQASAIALNLQNAVIGGSLAFNNGFHVEGIVFLGAARIAGNLLAARASFVSGGGGFSGLLIANVRVEGLIMFMNIRAFEGELLLDGARTTRFSDDGSLWRDAASAPRKGVVLFIDQFRYEAFQDSPINPTGQDWRMRLAWLQMQSDANLAANFNAQPFTHCAEVLRNMGDSHGSRMILFERERLRLKAKNVGFFEKLAGHALGVLAGYGYKTHFALYWAIGIWLLGAAIFWTADALGQMRPADPHVLAEERYQETLHPPTDYEPVKPLLYSADIFLPIVELGQQQYWLPRDAGERASDAAAAFPRLRAPCSEQVSSPPVHGGSAPDLIGGEGGHADAATAPSIALDQVRGDTSPAGGGGIARDHGARTSACGQSPATRALSWLFSGWLPKAYYYFEIAMGWLLVSIVIAGFSGLLGHAREE